MKHLLKMVCVSSALLLATHAMAEEAAKPDVVIAKGKLGQAPVQIVYDYLADRIVNEYGVAEYRNLVITQKSAGAEDFSKVNVEVLQSGLPDDAVAAQRFRFTFDVNDQAQVWQMKSVTQDWQCKRSKKKAWTQKPCQ
ncbi:hypothetical protein NT239_03015 [Chitinibacter sp. SCUT-21]|uniref:hypothetical protein n=1 Tax=Chitinibacter sp. SCUT-21 TaxID=2970891 RepID=UPI0035A739F3